MLCTYKELEDHSNSCKVMNLVVTIPSIAETSHVSLGPKNQQKLQREKSDGFGWAACWCEVPTSTTHPVPLTCDLLPPERCITSLCAQHLLMRGADHMWGDLLKGGSRHGAGWSKCRGHRSCQRNVLFLKGLFPKQLLTSAPSWSMALGSLQQKYSHH